MTAPTKTPRTRKFYEDYYKSHSNGLGRDDTHAGCAEFAEALETKLAAARAEADELARRVGEAVEIRARQPRTWPATHCSIPAIIARVREEMFKQQQEKDLKS